MAGYSDIAPELSKYVSPAAAKAYAESLAEAEPPAAKTLADLEPAVLSKFLNWLQHFRLVKRPRVTAGEEGGNATTAYLNYSPKQVAAKTGMTLQYVMARVAERDAVVSEVQTYGDDSFEAHPTVQSVQLDSPSAGDLTIDGSELASLAGGVGGVGISRPSGGSVSLSEADIVAGGGSVGSSQIVIPAALLPTPPASGDEVTVRADGNDSDAFTVPGE
jgi:hypothetical protein